MNISIHISRSIWPAFALALITGLAGLDICNVTADPTPLAATAQAANTLALDSIIFGEASSEQSHTFTTTRGELVAKGGLDQSARRLLPPETNGWAGGTMSFILKVDPDKLNYVSVRFWGNDTTSNRLLLFADGKQIGYRHLGDIDQLDFGSSEPACYGRFYYVTTPLPLTLTKGKTSLPFEIRSYGPIWGYGENFARYQRDMESPTRGIYQAYTHTDGCFTPAASEKQGEPPQQVTVRTEPGAEVLEKAKERVNRETSGLLASKKPLGQQEAQFLAKAWRVKWTPAFQNAEVVRLVTEAADAYVKAWQKDPKLALSDPRQYNGGWFGVAPLANAVRLLGPAISAQTLDEQVDYDGKTRSRREAWAELFLTSRDHLRTHRPHYTNQTMIQDMNIYLLNRGLASVAPARAFTETEARRYLYEAIGLEPWRGNDTDKGPDFRLGKDYWQLTTKGLTKELGYVGNYGEVLDWVTHIYYATADPDKPLSGDPKIAERLAKMEHARAVFRHPSYDEHGNRAMRLETIIGWRDSHIPGDICYAERSAWEGSALYSVAAILKPDSVGAARQMFADNQFFASVEDLVKTGGLRVTNTLLRIPDDYEAVLKAPESQARLPMSWDQPDSVFSDEEDGVVALKHGKEILYVSLYWRARYGINNLARVHHLTPQYDRIAVVHQETKFTPQGQDYTRPDWTNTGFGNGGHRYPDGAHSAHAGEVLPIAKIPEGVPFRPGNENIHAGKGDFYTLRYGPYLIAMNMSADKKFEINVPADSGAVTELVSKRTGISPGTVLPVPPRSTVVLRQQP